MNPETTSINSNSNSKLAFASEMNNQNERSNILQRGRGDSSRWIEEERNRSISRRGSSNSVEQNLERPLVGNRQQEHHNISGGNNYNQMNHFSNQLGSGSKIGSQGNLGNNQGRSTKDPKVLAIREETE